ncbi:hypothetical protein QAD02_019290 [Eretmocerus hayati]|uniref:Uncharacterized protein n=1 Tax=Eretmocerus hayati TaxID=131215 RepID=A0ACC2PJ66_9HYME|nr:hypothetical protein QAD02_019290 [Eretmocerus hayati]
MPNVEPAQQEYVSNNRGHQPKPSPDGKNETEQDPTYENVEIVMRPKPPHLYPRDHYSIAEPVGQVDTVHMIVPRNSIYCESERCGTRILVERPVIRCGMCSDQYFSNLILINVRQQREANAHLKAREMNGDDSDIEVISESDKGSDSESGDQADPEDLLINPRERFRQEMEQSNPIYDRQ